MTSAEISVLRLAQGKDTNDASILIARATVKVLEIVCDHKYGHSGADAWEIGGAHIDRCSICGVTRPTQL